MSHEQHGLPLLPSVSQLLHEHNVPSSKISQIPATGPKGRLLKGDVLSYVGAIASDYPSILSSRISQLQHLDLSNIKIAPPPAPPAPAASAEELPLPEPEDVKVSLPISFTNLLNLQDRVENGIGISLPFTTLLNRASHFANANLPLPRGTYGSKAQKLDSLFDQVVSSGPSSTAAGRVTSTGSYFPELETEVEAEKPARKATTTTTTTTDIIDILSGNVSRPREEAETLSVSSDEVPVLTLTVPAAERARAEEFLQRVRDYVEEKPDSLLLI